MILLPVAARDGVVYGMNNRTGAIVPFTFSRASGATLFDSNLDMQMVTANLPRIDFGNYAKTAKLLVERESTNILYQSDFLTTAEYDTLAGGTLENANWFGRDIRCAKLLFPSEQYSYCYKYCVKEINLNYSFSLFVTGNVDDLIISWENESSSTDVVTVMRGVPTINTRTNDFIRDNIFRSQFSGINSYALISYNGAIKYLTTSARPVWVSGYQIELGNVATSYIPTSGSQATRAAEQLTINLPKATEVYLKTTKNENTLNKNAGTWNIHNDIENDGIEVLAIMKY